MLGRAGAHHGRILSDDVAIGAAVLGTSLGLLTIVGLALLLRTPIALPFLAAALAAGAIALARGLARSTSASPGMLGILSAIPVLTLALLLSGGFGAAGGLGILFATAIALAAAAAARAARSAPWLDGDLACPGCGYDLAGLEWAPRCPECGFPDDADSDSIPELPRTQWRSAPAATSLLGSPAHAAGSGL